MRKITSLLVAMLCLLPLGHALAQAGNTCSDPIEITSLPYNTIDDTADYTSEYNGFPGTGCGTISAYLDGNEVIYAFTADFTGEVSLSMTPDNSYAGVFVYEDCSDIGVACYADAFAINGNSTAELNLMFEVAAGDTYYIVLSMWGTGDDMSYGYEMDLETVSCSRPGLITLESVSFDETVISWDGTAESYEYVLSTSNAEPTTAGVITTDTQVVFDDLVEGTNYYFWIRSLCEDDEMSVWADPVSFRSPGEGDTCQSAIAIADLPFTTTDNTENYANEYNGAPGTNCGTTNSYLDGNNVVYTYTADANTALQVTLESGANNTGLFVYDDCDAIGSNCHIGGVESSGDEDLTFELYVEEGQTYYILLSTWPAPQTMEYTLSIEEITCPIPGSLSLDNATPTTADFSWSSIDEADTYQYAVTTDDTEPSSEDASTTDNFVALTGLNADTDYYFWVRSVCDGTPTDWTEPYYFFTGYCEPSYTMTGDYLSAIYTDGGFIDIDYTTGSGSGGYHNESTQQVVVAPGMEFDMGTTYQGGSNTVKVWIDWNGNMAFEESEVVYDNYTTSANQEFTVEVPADATPGNYRMRVLSRYANQSDMEPCGTSYSYGSAVDFTVVVGDEPECMPVSNLEAEVLSASEIEVTWDGPSNAESWEVEYVENNGPQGSGTTEIATTNSIVLEGLSIDTDYNIYVTPACDSEVGLPRSTSVFLGYCIASTNYGEWLSVISTEGALIDLDYSATSQPDNGYENNASTEIAVFPGQEIEIHTEYSYSGTNGVSAWVDWNHNLDFGADELIYNNNGSQSQTGQFTIPEDAEEGSYRLRIRGQWNNANPPACGQESYGSTIDFTLVVVEEPNCTPVSDITIEAISMNEVVVNWEGPENAVSWEVEYMEAGEEVGTGTTESVSENTITIDGLEADTYYDVYITPTCDDEEGLARKATFFTGYCTPTYTSTADFFTAISTEDAIQDVEYSTTSRPTNGYDNQADQEIVVFAGSSFQLNTSYQGGGQTVKAWGDWNKDLEFGEDEVVYSGTSTTANQSGEVNVPSDLEPGEYRFRLVSVYGTSVTLDDACGTYTYGSTVDFTITVVELDCMPATDISFTTNANNDVIMSWTGNDDVAEWTIEYGEEGFTTGTGTVVTTDQDSYLFDDLELDTGYDFYITGDCDDEEGLIIGPKRFFFGYCIPSVTYSEYLSEVETDGAFIDIEYSANSQPSGGYTNQTDQTLIIIPGQDITLSTVYSAGSNGVNAWVDWDRSLTFEDDEKVYTNVGSSAAQSGTLDLPSDIEPGNYRLRVRGQWGTTANPPACGEVNYGSTIDFTLVVLDPDSCLPPLDIFTTAVYDDAIEIDWVDNADDVDSWEIEYGPTGFAQGNGTIVQADEKPFLIEGLESSQSSSVASYDFYVRAICSGEDEGGNWSPMPHTETTLCGAVTSIPYILDFEASETPNLPPCTSQAVGEGSNAWYTEYNPGYYLGETTVLRYDRSDTNAADAWFFTTGLELEAGTWYTISYDYMVGNPQFSENLRVAMGPNADASAMTEELADHQGIDIENVAQNAVEFRVQEDGVYYFGFHAYSDAAQFALFLDNIKIDYSLGVDDLEDITFSLYPNPAVSTVNVESSATMERITVYNMLGQTIQTVKPMDVNYSLNVEELQTGTYVLEIEADGRRQTKQLIKK